MIKDWALKRNLIIHMLPQNKKSQLYRIIKDGCLAL